MKHWKNWCLTGILTLTAMPAWGQAQSADTVLPPSGEPRDVRNILTRNIPLWEHQTPYADDTSVGAESNPTGNPIGGGEGYSDIVTEGDFVASNRGELEAALEQAEKGDVIFLPGDAEIDLGGVPTLSIPGGVTIASDRGHNDSLGALVFSDELDTPFMFKTAGDYVRITGIRLRDPFPHRARTPLSSRGISTTHFGMEVDNCELSAFSHTALRADDGSDRLYIHHNSFHHNQRGGLGYGLTLDGGTALLEANKFDWGRHHIAATGRPGCGYEARYNIVGPNANSHAFDMHGGRDRGDGTVIAGDWMNVHHNTFHLNDEAVVIRGVASQGAVVHHNWFIDTDIEEHVRSDDNTLVYDNVVGPDKQPYHQPEGDNQ